jgi:hypothetical protein
MEQIKFQLFAPQKDNDNDEKNLILVLNLLESLSHFLTELTDSFFVI